ncbi:hypothetical protein FRC06_000917 [Ceratobasidium sp. 370]|nr:hypothetical protein FRC06_000917 [Ceratobasidium sp. 370]
MLKSGVELMLLSEETCYVLLLWQGEYLFKPDIPPLLGLPPLTPPPRQSGSRGFGRPGPKSLLPSSRQVSTSYVSETFTLSYTVECQRQGRKTSHVAFEIQTKGIPNVNAFSTGLHLKELVRNHAMKDWLVATFNHPLQDGMCTLRDKSGVDMVDSFPDTPTLRSQCLARGSKGQEHFAFGRTVKVVLMLTPPAYEMVEKHIDECRSKEPEYEDVAMAPVTPTLHDHPQEPMGIHPAHVVPNASSQDVVSNWPEMVPTLDRPKEPTTPDNRTLKRAFVTSPTSVVGFPPTKRLASNTMQKTQTISGGSSGQSKDSKLQAALQLHGQQRKPRVDDALMDEPQPLDFSDPTLASHANILYNPAFKDHNLGAGTFKRCHKGKLVIQPIPPTGLGSPDLAIIAIKQPFIIPPGKDTPTQLPPGDEIQFIVQEATVWRWATTLLSMVYNFIEKHPKAPEQDPPSTPQIQFVKIGVAKSVSTSSSSHAGPEGGFLVEAYIRVENGFVRYMGNNSARPLSFHQESYAFKERFIAPTGKVRVFYFQSLLTP